MRRNAGFTLVELMVALLIGAMVLLMAQRIFGGLLDGVGASLEARERQDAEMNGRRRLGQIIGSVDINSAEFLGEPRRARFGTWMPAPEDWPVPRTVTLAAAQSALVAAWSGGSLRLLEATDSVDFDYLTREGADERWVRRWQSPSDAPLALRLRVARGTRVDTLLLIVGHRG